MLLRDYYRLLKQSLVLAKMWVLSVYGPFTGEVHPRILTGPFQLRIFCDSVKWETWHQHPEGGCSPASPRSRGYFRGTLDFGHLNPTPELRATAVPCELHRHRHGHCGRSPSRAATQPPRAEPGRREPRAGQAGPGLGRAGRRARWGRCRRARAPRGGSAGPGPALSCAVGRRCLNSGGCRAPVSFAPLRVVQYIPPPYPSQEGAAVSPSHLHSGLSCCAAAPPSTSPLLASGSPHFCPAYALDNLAFTGDESYTAYPAENSRNQRSEDSSDEPEGLLEDYARNNLSPPRYEEIYPFSS
ncbi:transmembrane protein 174 [Agelaius phoeniceus]|uniref:transmembrane protein 174 n=1 Tax=Agelaius phoeniceus TaxID=39638 RepID=UPI004054F9CE